MISFKDLTQDLPVLMEGTTNASTVFELALVAFITHGNKKYSAFIKDINKDKGYTDWLAAASKDKKWNVDPKDHYAFAQKLRSITGGTTASSAGQTKPSTSAFWAEVTKKGKDTSKADITIGSHQVSVKGPQARLMSGVKEESLATLYAAFASIGIQDLGQNLAEIIDSFVSRVETEGATMDTRTIRKLDPKELSAKNKQAFKELRQQSDVKVLAEAAFTKAFANEEFAKEFAWEAMSGQKKFNNGLGTADSMLVWPYNLSNIVWKTKLNSKHAYVSKVSSQMKFSSDVKSNSRKVKGIGKTGYTISQTIDLAFKTADSEFEQSKQVSENKKRIYEMQLTEGVIDEGRFLDKIKSIWNTLKTAIIDAWNKLITVLNGLKDMLSAAINAGTAALLNEFDLEVVPKFKNEIKF
jgi:hypothetical protein